MKRKSNFELLRIIAMIMIVAHHFSLHGGFAFAKETLTVNRFWIQLLQLGGKIGVNIFVLISGYFLIDITKIKIDKIFKLWMQVTLWSVFIYILFVCSGLEGFSIKALIKSVFPIIFDGWWFASTYFVLYLFTPFLNLFLQNLEKEKYKKLIGLMSVCWCIIPTFSTKLFQSNDLIWFVYLYTISGYIKLWCNDKVFQLKSKTYFKYAVILVVLVYLTTITFDIAGIKFGVFYDHSTYFYSQNKLPILLISLFLFLGFKNLQNIKYSKVINTFSSATFGIYLIHDDDYVRNFLWCNVFNNASYSDSAYLIPYSVAVICIVYIACTILELMNIYTVQKWYMKVFEKYKDKFVCLLRKCKSKRLFTETVRDEKWRKSSGNLSDNCN